jgi:glycosyltransferase involved in cell wall biosynthesis
MLTHITPVIITFNEAPNIRRTLERLTWARRVIVVDSESTDETATIVKSFPNTELVAHRFASLADQWNFAVRETGINTDWLLRLDADYILEDDLIEELAKLDPQADVGAYAINFIYCIYGKRLRASLYPTSYKLFRRGQVSFVQDGHTERPEFTGRGVVLEGHICHDDRKPVSRWLSSQDKYMAAEAQKLSEAQTLNLDAIDRLRKYPAISWLVVFFYCLFGKRLILDGRAGLFYSLQRTAAEIILALNLLNQDLQQRASAETVKAPGRNQT